MLTNRTPDDHNDTGEQFSRLRPVHHAFGCGVRIPCPEHGRLGPYLPAERLRNGDTVAHCCGQTWRPDELARVAS